MSKAGAILSPKEKRFVEEFPIDFNGVQSVLRSGFKCKNEKVAAVYAHRLLSKANISKAIADRVKQFSEKANTDLDRIFTEAKRLGFSDIRQLFDQEGKLISVHKLPDDIAACVSSVEVEEVWEGKGESREFKGYRTKLKLWDKNSALDKLSRYHALYKDPGTKDNPLNVNFNWGTLPIDELARIRKNPELALAQRN